jgi:hypothetical protein
MGLVAAWDTSSMVDLSVPSLYTGSAISQCTDPLDPLGGSLLFYGVVILTFASEQKTKNRMCFPVKEKAHAVDFSVLRNGASSVFSSHAFIN